MRRALLTVLFLACATPAFAEATFEEAVSFFEDKNYTEARTIAEPLANADDPRAMAMMGAFFQKGLGTPIDLAAARVWFQKAADKNHPGAQFSLAMMLLDNSLGENDPEAAAVLLEKAATGGNVQAQYNLGLVYAGRYGTAADWKKAAEWFRKAADQNYPEAQYNYGLLFLDGNGVEKDQVAAADWLSRAAVKGMPEAALEYGVLVMRGEGVQRDEKIGLKWLLYAANRGHPVAQNRLARIYASGVGSIEVDVVEAAKWNLIATKGGRPDATLDEMMAKLTAAQKKQSDQLAAEFVSAEAPAPAQ
jgi:uncharacterized protein